jgi:hypothetical protein
VRHLLHQLGPDARFCKRKTTSGVNVITLIFFSVNIVLF